MRRSGFGLGRGAVHAALLAGVVALAAPAGATPAGPGFDPPRESPLLLSRKVVRELSGGAAIVATRRYRVTFHEIADGWVVRGELVTSEIDVPPALAAIAAVERGRSDDGLFPMHLDRTGLIVPGPVPAAMGREAIAGAVGLARRLGGSDSAVSPGFIDQVDAAASSPGAGLTRWPEALFLPGALRGSSEQSFRLPGGDEGSVQVLLESDPAPGLAMMGRAARTVITTAPGTRRVAREEWTITRASPPSDL